MEGQAGHEAISALVQGIQAGILSTSQLSEAAAAAPTAASLRVLVEHEPRCVPRFLELLARRGELAAAGLAECLTVEDLCSVFRAYPPAACTILDGATAEPASEHPGLHPLPARVSFGPRNLLERVRETVNPQTSILAFYQPDVAWGYDAARLEAPAWHRALGSHAWGKPVLDGDIRVCHVPDLICAELLSALVQNSAAREVPKLPVFEHPVIRGVVSYCFWNGACRLEMTHVAHSVWGLATLILETAFFAEPSYASISADFVGAKAIVDVLAILVEAAGVLSLGRPSDLLSAGRLWDALCCLGPLAIVLGAGGRQMQILVILIYWLQLLTIFTFAQSIASAFLPILRLPRSLVPAATVSFVAFAAFTHAFHCIQGGAVSETFYWSFATLFAVQLRRASLHRGASGLEQVLCYAAVAFFSVFLVNIGIRVIGEQYQREKGRSALTFRYVRAKKCLAFLTRARVVPCRVLPKRAANALSYAALILGVGAQAWGARSGRAWPYPRSQLVACLALMRFLAYQNPSAPWACRAAARGSVAGRHYLWVALPHVSVAAEGHCSGCAGCGGAPPEEEVTGHED